MIIENKDFAFTQPEKPQATQTVAKRSLANLHSFILLNQPARQRAAIKSYQDVEKMV